jgi:hypothetical protein
MTFLFSFLQREKLVLATKLANNTAPRHMAEKEVIISHPKVCGCGNKITKINLIVFIEEFRPLWTPLIRPPVELSTCSC